MIGRKIRSGVFALHFFGFISLIFLLFIPKNLPAQIYPTRNYTMRDGLPGMAVQSIFKDSKGLLWIGTKTGLCTYDGKSFRIFKPSEGMTANQIWAIAEDPDGIMWFGSYGEGLFKYDGKKFEQFTTKDGLANDAVRVLVWSPSFNCLIAGSLGGISAIQKDTILSTQLEIIPGEKKTPVTGLADAGDFIYVTTYDKNNPLRFYPHENRLINSKAKDGRYPNNSFCVFISSKADTIFSLAHQGVKIFTHDNQIVSNASMGQVFGIAEDKRGDLWFASWSYPNRNMIEGVFRYDGKTFRNFTTAFGITDKEIWTLYYDPEQDLLWIGTLNEGLFRVPFSSIEIYPPDYFGLEKQHINGIFIDSKENLWISGIQELIKMDSSGKYTFVNKPKILQATQEFWQKTGRHKNFHFSTDSINLRAQNLDPASIGFLAKEVDFWFQDMDENSGKLYFTNRFGIFELDPPTERIRCLGPEGANDFFSVPAGDTIVFTGSGYTVINANFENTTPYESDTSLIAYTENDEPRVVNHIAKRGNQVWFTTTTTGLWMSQGLRLINFNRSDSTISKNLNDVCFGDEGQVFFGSNSGEIYMARLEGDQLKINHRIAEKQGLKGHTISWLVYDPKGYLWAGTNWGLNCIDLKNLFQGGENPVRFYDEEEGYTAQASHEAVIDPSGKLWICGHDQLLAVNTNQLLADGPVSKIIPGSFLINSSPADSLLETPAGGSAQIILSRKLRSTENNLIFNFDIANYLNPRKDLFRHQLTGYEKNSNQWSSERKVTFSNLPPGKYSLQIESRNLQSLRIAEPLIIQFTIRHPWWGLWYVQILLGFLLISATFYLLLRIINAKKNKQREKLEIEKTISELEMQALKAQMNPHFIFNCITGIQYYVLENKMEEVMYYLADFSKVIRGSLENASLPMVALNKEIDFLKSYLRLEQMRFEDKFEFEIRVASPLEEGFIQLPPMIIQPFVENSIRHGFRNLPYKGHLTIDFEEDAPDVLKCTLSDNGVGRNTKKTQHEFFVEDKRLHSTIITERRMRLFNKPQENNKYKICYTDLFEDGKPAGLKVELFMPLSTS